MFVPSGSEFWSGKHTSIYENDELKISKGFWVKSLAIDQIFL